MLALHGTSFAESMGRTRGEAGQGGQWLVVLSQLTISIRCQLLAMSQRSISLAQAWTWAWRFPFLQFPLECWAGSWLSFLEPLLCCPKSVGGDWVSLPYIELWWQGNRCQLPGCLCCLPACCRGKSFFVCERFNKLHCSHCSLRVSGTLQTSLSWTNPPPPPKNDVCPGGGQVRTPLPSWAPSRKAAVGLRLASCLL